MSVLFVIDGLGAGGKEKRLVSLLGQRSKEGVRDDILFVLDDDVHYTEVHSIPLQMIVSKRRFRWDPWPAFVLLFASIRFGTRTLCTWGNTASVYALLAKLLARVAIVNCEITTTRRPHESLSRWESVSLRFADVVVANSRAGLESFLGPAALGVVIHNGIPFRDFESMSGRNSDEIIVLMVASYTRLKDHRTFMQAANVLTKKYPAVRFVCIGAGDRTPWEVYKVELGLERVELRGKTNAVEKDQFESDIGVLCSYYEGMPNSVLEFMSLGKPVVVTSRGGVGELFVRGDEGFVLDTGDVQGLVERLELLIQDPRLRQEMGARAASTARTHFSLSGMSKKFSTVFESVGQHVVQ